MRLQSKSKRGEENEATSNYEIYDSSNRSSCGNSFNPFIARVVRIDTIIRIEREEKDMKKWYVNYYNNGVLVSHCFEDDEKQAKHFASLVNGTVYRGW